MGAGVVADGDRANVAGVPFGDRFIGRYLELGQVSIDGGFNADRVRQTENFYRQDDSPTTASNSFKSLMVLTPSGNGQSAKLATRPIKCTPAFFASA